MNKFFVTLSVLLSAALLVNSQFTDCVSNQWDWQVPHLTMDLLTYEYSWIWKQDSDPVVQAERVAWCGNGNCFDGANQIASSCTYDPAPSAESALDLRCFCVGNEDNIVQSEGPGLCDFGFTFTEAGCVENCLVDPNQHCATCTGDHELCASCVPGWFLTSDGTCVSDCGNGFYGSKLDWTCYACGYHWVGRQATPDSYCYTNCFIPTQTSGSFGMNPACLNANQLSQTCKCLCPPDNTPNFVVGGSVIIEQQCQTNTYQQVVNGEITQSNVITRWWVPYTIKPLWASFGQKYCENNCPGVNCDIFCDHI